MKLILDNLSASIIQISRGVSTPKQHLLLAEQKDTDSHSDRLGNGEQTALLLNTLFMLLPLPTEFSHDVTAWKESTTDNRPCLLQFLPSAMEKTDSWCNGLTSRRPVWDIGLLFAMQLRMGSTQFTETQHRFGVHRKPTLYSLFEWALMEGF